MRKLLPLLFAFAVVWASCKKDPDPVPAPLPAPTDNLGNWQGIASGAELLDLAFRDPLNGIATTPTGLLRTADGGKTWSPVSGASGHYINIHVINQRYFYAVGPTLFSFSSDSGATWKHQPTIQENFDVFFTSPSRGYVAGLRGLYMTSDTGATWTKLHSEPVMSVFMTDAQNGWAGSYVSGRMYKITNNTVTQFYSDPSWVRVTSIYFTDDQRGWATFYSGGISRTVDGGISWRRINIEGPTSDVTFLNPNVGFMASGHGIYRSLDGGVNWAREVHTPTQPSPYMDLFVLNETHIWAASDKLLVKRNP
jgi:photosystem II stability/assembly factor-like uncharacterized protein